MFVFSLLLLCLVLLLFSVWESLVLKMYVSVLSLSHSNALSHALLGPHAFWLAGHPFLAQIWKGFFFRSLVVRLHLIARLLRTWSDCAAIGGFCFRVVYKRKLLKIGYRQLGQRYQNQNCSNCGHVQLYAVSRRACPSIIISVRLMIDG